MTTNDEPKSSHLLIGLVLGALAGLIAATFSRRQAREALRERGGESLDYLNQQAGRLRDTADGLVQKGKEFIAPQRYSVQRDTEGEKQAYQEKQRETSGG